MRNLFNHLDKVRQVIASRPFGLVTDVDGTISRIAPSPEEAIVSPLCRKYLSALVDRLDLVAVISGRPLTEVMGMVGVEGLVYVGNHGLEMWNRGAPEKWQGSERYVDTITSAVSAIKNMLDVDGLYFENKGLTASIHYRNCTDIISVRSRILAAVGSLSQASDLRISNGKMVVELRPKLKADKGSALNTLIEKYRLSGAIYIGDDVTDVDAFEALQGSGTKGIAIGVVSDETPPQLYKAADYTINGVEQVEQLLGQLVDLTAD
ncbi:trehalose-phosphatase [Chloroflexota bacterium]